MQTKLIEKILKYKIEIKIILFLFIATRIILTIIGTSSYILLEQFHSNEYYWHYSKYLFLDIWGIWDSGWYLKIAENWYPDYENFNLHELGQTSFNFFPLYPLLIKILGIILLNNYFIAGLLVSNFFFLISAFYLYKLVLIEKNHEIALKSVIYLFLAPAVFIFSGVFTESLFLALTLICFYYAKTNKWFLVGIAGFFLSLTKSLGILILLPLCYYYIKKKRISFKKIGKDLLYLFLIPFGLLLFSFFNYIKTGDFLAFVHSQQISWGHTTSNPFMVIIDGLYSNLISQKINAVFTIILLLILIKYFKKIKFEYWIYSMMMIFIHLLSGSCMNSMFRYALILFPLYMLLPIIIKNKYVELTVMIFLALIQGFLMVFWSTGFLVVV